ncbi:MAG: hypothetical protein AABX23_03560 [Nanoarchaeota archaeon]
MFTKTQAEIMKVFVSKINMRFSIKEVAEILNKPYPLIHRSIKVLIEQKFIKKDEKGFISLNYKENHSELAYIESLRSNEKISRDKTLFLFAKDIKEKIGLDFFILLVFGSYIEKDNPRDIDILLIVEEESLIINVEKIISNLASHFTKNFEIQVISIKSMKQMISKREDINLINETLNKHLFLYGGEIYYKILSDAR